MEIFLPNMTQKVIVQLYECEKLPLIESSDWFNCLINTENVGFLPIHNNDIQYLIWIHLILDAQINKSLSKSILVEPVLSRFLW